MVGTDPVGAHRPAASTRASNRAGCAPGSASAAAPSRWCGPRATAFRSRSRSSAAARRASGRSWTSITSRSQQFGHGTLPVAAHSPGHVAATDEQAREEVWPHYQAMMTRIGAERGWPPVTRAHFDREAGPDGALCVGSPETVAAQDRRDGPHARPVALRHEVQQRPAPARGGDAEHRALRHPRGAAGARAAGRAGGRARRASALTGRP